MSHLPADRPRPYAQPTQPRRSSRGPRYAALASVAALLVLVVLTAARIPDSGSGTLAHGSWVPVTSSPATPTHSSASHSPASSAAAAPRRSATHPSRRAHRPRPTPHHRPQSASSSAAAPGAPAGGSSSAPASTGDTLVFDDEFNGTGVDRSKWRVADKTYASNEESIDLANNVSVSGGVLTIQARRQTYSVGGTTRHYTSGYLDTIGLSSFRYGRWEMRAQLPDAQGMWPAFWLRSDHSAGEADILEAIGGMPNSTVQTVFPSTNDGSVKRTHMYDVAGGIDGWHVYGFTWTPTSMTWDVDGVRVFSVNASDVPWVSSAFQDTMNIRLNLQVGGTMPAYFQKPVTSSTPFPAAYRVDYVRVYQHR